MSIKQSKLDPRVIRTRQLLRNALISLINEKGFENITVQEITDRATLNKATFYLHYRDKEELLVKSTNQLIEELTQTVGKPTVLATDFTPLFMTQLLTLVFQHFERNADFYDVILNRIGTPPVVAAIQDPLEQLAMRWYQHLSNRQTIPLVEPDMLLRFFSSGCIGLVQQWLHQSQRLSAEQMAEIFIHLIVGGIYHSAGLPPPDKTNDLGA
ncbi:MAG: TetR/AcrR family transcriptional regulator [Phototrophicaceae bacterium]